MNKIEKNIYLKNNILKFNFIRTINILQEFFLPLAFFLVRLKMSNIFWYSGLTKISDWQATLYLFANEYKVPLVSPAIAAVMSTCTELSTPILLLIGFMTRLAVLPLITMTIVIQLTYQNSQEHIYWGLLLSLLLCNGPGKLSIDHLIKKNFT